MFEYSERMAAAMDMADQCWAKAMEVEPVFVEYYLYLAEKLLLSKPEVTGDEIKQHCEDNLLFRPASLHPNVWVSGVRALMLLGWTTKVAQTVPTKMHNHMNTVTKWKSNLYEQPHA